VLGPTRGDGAEADLELAPDADAIERAGAEVAVDFTVAEAARHNLRWCAEHSVHAVVGTTGLTDDDFASLADLFGEGRGANAVVAPNFSVGAALMMRCAELCAPFFDGVEIIELHHDRKRDAPSGTSLTTARRIEAARAASSTGALMNDPTELEVLAGARGGATPDGVHVHSVRLPGLVAHQEVLFGTAGETLTIRHDSTDRVSFMPGVLLAIRRVAGLEGLTIGLDRLLGD
jgi:4-hydroxy-tetrahydrodipicolinate reductase